MKDSGFYTRVSADGGKYVAMALGSLGVYSNKLLGNQSNVSVPVPVLAGPCVMIVEIPKLETFNLYLHFGKLS